ncbi:ABC transporter substrate-binding protein [Lacimicrobium sp. SS2-24]|uniref:substrate-binding periplasmic protein n=1 Tax=Lacimicrobium sp. SS2-24 TaxID=2005569 RepID=UPI001438F897|nr:ABC transporter substrate-binding protein [Lacimicrobium sp. SS2-24]
MRRILLLFLLAVSPLQAKQLIVAFGQDKPPFVIGKSRDGLEIELFRAALNSGGDYEMVVLHMPNNRLQTAIQSIPGIDAVASVSKTPDLNHFVDRFIYFENYAVTRKKDDIALEGIKDLQNYSVVAWQQAHLVLGDEFYQHFRPHEGQAFNSYYRELASQQSQNAMFWLRRAQVILVDKTIFKWYRQQLSLSIDTSDEVQYHPLFPGKTWYGAAFRDSQDKAAFEAGLKTIKSSGLYDLLYQTSSAFEPETPFRLDMNMP